MMDLKSICDHLELCLNAAAKTNINIILAFVDLTHSLDFTKRLIPTDTNNLHFHTCKHNFGTLSSMLLMALTNEMCIKASLSLVAHHKITTVSAVGSGWITLHLLLLAYSPHLGGTNGNIQMDLSNLHFKEAKTLNAFYSQALHLEQEIRLSQETMCPTQLLHQYLVALSLSQSRCTLFWWIPIEN